MLEAFLLQDEGNPRVLFQPGQAAEGLSLHAALHCQVYTAVRGHLESLISFGSFWRVSVVAIPHTNFFSEI